MLVQTEFCEGGRQWVVNVVAEHISTEDCVYTGTAQREGLGGGPLDPPLFCKNKNKLN